MDIRDRNREDIPHSYRPVGAQAPGQGGSRHGGRGRAPGPGVWASPWGASGTERSGCPHVPQPTAGRAAPARRAEWSLQGPCPHRPCPRAPRGLRPSLPPPGRGLSPGLPRPPESSWWFRGLNDTLHAQLGTKALFSDSGKKSRWISLRKGEMCTGKEGTKRMNNRSLVLGPQRPIF